MATGLTLTTAGAAEIEAANQAGEVLAITSVVIGDGGGATLPTDPDELAAVTALFGPFGQEPFDSGSSNEGFISGQVVINCRDYPGETLREAGLVSASGTLIAYGAYPATYLPAQTDSIIKEIVLTLVLTLTHATNVQLVIDPNLATLTQDSGDKRYLRRSLNLSDVDDAASARDNLDLGDSATRDVGTTAGTVAAGDDSRITGALQKESNLSDLTDTEAARDNLGLGDSATLDVGTTEGTVAAGDDSRITGALQKESNLSDLTDTEAARDNLGLGDSATLDVGTTAGTVAAGDDSRITGALQKESNLSDLTDTEAARDNLDLGDSATLDVGTTAGTVAAGDDSRITGALQKESNLSDLTDTEAARDNLDLGDSATRDVGTTAGTVAAGDDSRITGALQKENNLSDLTNIEEARKNMKLGNSATRDVGTTVGTVAAGDDSRITGALQKESNLSDLTSAAEARDNLGLSADGEGFRAIVDAILYPGIIIPSEKSPAVRFPWQTWEDLSNTFADRVVRIGSEYGATGGSNKVKIAASNLPPHWHKSGDRSPGETWDPTTTHGTDNQKSGPLNMTAGTYTDAAGEQEAVNDAIDVTNEYVTLCLWKRTA